MDFKTLYDSLNLEQRQAVDAIDGTVMVVAGPGTGKTQVLGARVANILRLTDVGAENILCLTFTEAATVALRDRLYQFIGSDAQRVNIYTYHAFCNMIIQENKNLFGHQDLDAASDIEVLEIVKEIIDELPAGHLLKRYRGDIYYDISNLIGLFSIMKKEAMDVEMILKECASFLKSIENSEEYILKRDSKKGKKGDFKQIYYSELDKINNLKAAAELFDVYQEKMANRKRYDYHDMINWVIAEFKANESLLLQYQEQFQYILVDEYQDTNGAQNMLLLQLINYWDNPNVFVVGDDDQSIYKFQGANVENIKDLYDLYEEHVKLIVLTQNYRSTPSILNISNKLISNNTERLVGQVQGLSKEIVSANEQIKSADKPVSLKIFPNSYQEVIDTANCIKQLMDDGTSAKNIAVLYRNHKQSDDLVKYLQAEKIPFNISVSKDILQEPIIKQLILLLQYLELERQKLDKGEHLLFEILHSKNFIQLSAFEIAKLSTIIKKDREKGWRESIHSITEGSENLGLSTDSIKELRQFMADVEYWIKELHNANLQSVVEQVISKGGFISRAISSNENIFQVQCLKTFFNFLKSESAKNPSLKLKQFLETIEILEDNKLGLSLNKVVYGAEGVNFMTVHGSKGLEFDHVFMIGCTSDKWEKNGQSLPFNLSRIVKGEPKSAHEEEGRRLFYVGITRARKELIISYSKLNSADKPISRSVYVSELEADEKLKITECEIKELELLEFFSKTMNVQNEEFLKLTQMDFINHELENFRLSATNLNSYLKCPVTFFYQNIIRVPSALNESMTFGTAVHGALETLHNKWAQSDKKAFPPLEILIEAFKKVLARHRESFTDLSFKRRLDFGDEILPKYYRANIDSWINEKDIETELSFKNIEIEGVPIRGQIDKIIIQESDITVVDYKTGNYEYAKSKLSPPLDPSALKPGEDDHNKLYGGDYWRQIMFYYLLIKQDNRYTKKVSKGVLEFIEPVKGEFIKKTIGVHDADVEIVKQQILKVYSSIMNKEFDEGCNKADCVWCNFNNYYMKKQTFSSANLLYETAEEIDER